MESPPIARGVHVQGLGYCEGSLDGLVSTSHQLAIQGRLEFNLPADDDDPKSPTQVVSQGRLEFNLPADDDDPKSPTQVVSVAKGKYGKRGNHMQATRLLALAAVFTAFSGGLTGTPIEAIQANELTAVITTTKGDIHVTLFPAEAPLTVANFVNLAQRGYYDGLKFHRVLANFMIQGGDPTGTGSGGPGYRFADEFSPSLRHDSAGTLSMANSGPSTNGSQFFITHGPTPHLDDIHSIFGKVSSGRDVVDAIAQDDVMTTIVIEGDPSSLLAAQKEQVDEWNTILDRR